jgi:hypothetical protein
MTQYVEISILAREFTPPADAAKFIQAQITAKRIHYKQYAELLREIIKLIPKKQAYQSQTMPLAVDEAMDRGAKSIIMGHVNYETPVTKRMADYQQKAVTVANGIMGQYGINVNEARKTLLTHMAVKDFPYIITQLELAQVLYGSEKLQQCIMRPTGKTFMENIIPKEKICQQGSVITIQPFEVMRETLADIQMPKQQKFDKNSAQKIQVQVQNGEFATSGPGYFLGKKINQVTFKSFHEIKMTSAQLDSMVKTVLSRIGIYEYIHMPQNEKIEYMGGLQLSFDKPIKMPYYDEAIRFFKQLHTYKPVMNAMDLECVFHEIVKIRTYMMEHKAVIPTVTSAFATNKFSNVVVCKQKHDHRIVVYGSGTQESNLVKNVLVNHRNHSANIYFVDPIIQYPYQVTDGKVTSHYINATIAEFQLDNVCEMHCDVAILGASTIFNTADARYTNLMTLQAISKHPGAVYTVKQFLAHGLCSIASTSMWHTKVASGEFWVNYDGTSIVAYKKLMLMIFFEKMYFISRRIVAARKGISLLPEIKGSYNPVRLQLLSKVMQPRTPRWCPYSHSTAANRLIRKYVPTTTANIAWLSAEEKAKYIAHEQLQGDAKQQDFDHLSETMGWKFLLLQYTKNRQIRMVSSNIKVSLGKSYTGTMDTTGLNGDNAEEFATQYADYIDTTNPLDPKIIVSTIDDMYRDIQVIRHEVESRQQYGEDLLGNTIMDYATCFV